MPDNAGHCKVARQIGQNNGPARTRAGVRLQSRAEMMQMDLSGGEFPTVARMSHNPRKADMGRILGILAFERARIAVMLDSRWGCSPRFTNGSRAADRRRSGAGGTGNWGTGALGFELALEMV